MNVGISAFLFVPEAFVPFQCQDAGVDPRFVQLQLLIDKSGRST